MRHVLLFVLAIAAVFHAGPAAALPACGITAEGQLVLFDTDDPGTVQILEVTGLAPGETLLGLDVRPSNGRLYALGDLTATLYTISLATGAATPVGALDVPLNGGVFGLDVDPVNDVLRLTSNTGQNMRIDPDTGQVIDGAPGPGVQPDTNFGPGLPQVTGAAHTNSFSGAAVTRLYVLDAAVDALKFTDAPNGGVLTVVANLGIDIGADASFDIAAENIAYAAVPIVGSTTLYEVDLSTAASTPRGTIGDGTLFLRGIAVFTPELRMTAVTTGSVLVSFSNLLPGDTLSSDPITGLRPGEAILGIDYRPGTRQLYALGSTSRLYTLTPDGAATEVGLVPFAVPLDGTHFGMDFDPVTDRVRIVSNTKQNLRVHPDTGKVIDGDPDTDGVQPDAPLTPANPAAAVVAIAHTQSAAGATTSTLIGIEATGDRVVRIGGVDGEPPADTGTVTDLHALGVNATAITAFDMAPVGFAGGDVGYIVVESGLTSRLHRLTATGIVPFFAGNTDDKIAALAIAPAGVVRLSQAHVYVLEGGLGMLTVSRDSSAGAASVEYRVTGGTAANGADYDLPGGAGVVQFELGELQTSIPIPILQDPLDEVGETIEIVLEHPSAGLTLGTPSAVTVTIADDDGAANAAPTITILQPNIQVFRSMDGTVSLAGTASDDAGVVQVTWINVENKAAGVATGTSAWSVEGVPLVRPTQFITVTAVDAQGATASQTVEVRAFEGQYYLPEGATGGFFDFDLLLANPTGGEAPVEITFLKADGTSIPHAVVLPAASRTTILVDAIAGLENAEVSTIVESTSGRPIVVERTMRWDESGYGAHTEKATEAFKGPTWYFAEGAQGFFQTYFLLENPGGGTVTANVSMFTEDGATAFSQDFAVPAGSRRTIAAGHIPALADRAFWTRIAFDADDMGIAERAMYFGAPTFNAGHAAGGVNVPATSWLHAEGATGSFFTTFLLLANPNDAEAHVTVTYLPAGGEAVSVPHVLPARGRVSINVALEDPALADAAVAARVQSDLPILSERTMFWPGEPAAWYEAHNSFGVTATGTRWGLAEGRVGGPQEHQTYILLANPGDSPATVTIDYLRENGTIVSKTYTVPAASRYNVFVNDAVPELVDEGFGALIDASAPIFVERAMYANAGGVVWASGTNATATRLP